MSSLVGAIIVIVSMGFFSSMAGVVSMEPLRNWQFGFQTPASPIMEGIISFHDDLFVFLVLILGFVFYLLSVIIYRYGMNRKDSVERLVHASTLEIIWTIIPALILVIIAIPSFSLLYSMDEIVEPMLSIKVVGHQWYWSYEFLDPTVVARLYGNTGYDAAGFGSGNFDSYMLADDELWAGSELKGLRLLAVDNYLSIPAEMHTRALVTSADVLHSWAVPALGVKMDACPGRLNQLPLFIKRPGVYYGQCSEICGVNHGFMPIGIIAVDSATLHDLLQGEMESVIATLQALIVELYFI